MNLIKINLLPYRELEEQRLKKQFQVIMIVGAIAGVLAAAAVYATLLGMVENQLGRNESLQTGIAGLDKELAEIKTLNEKKRNFLERRQKVAELDNKRFEGARIIDTLNQLVPDLSLTGDASKNIISNQYTITGKAISDNKVAMFMTALPSTGVFDPPELLKIEKTNDGQQFSLKALLLENKVVIPDSEGPSASAPASSAASNPEGGK